MTKAQVQKIFEDKAFPYPSGEDEIIETHISWVILSGNYAYKFKKPIRYSFLDFSTLERRHFYCRRELDLNNRFTSGIYLRVLPVFQEGTRYRIGGTGGRIVDYVLLMRRMDNRRQMDLLLQKQAVTREDIRQIARQVAAFHRESPPVAGAEEASELIEKFSDLLSQTDLIGSELGRPAAAFIQRTVKSVAGYLDREKAYLSRRSKEGWVIDGHGDLHSKNIILEEQPIIFDCIEFNDAFRHVDVLNEIAFFCMDLDSFGQEALADAFLYDYTNRNDALRDERDRRLFLYYKLYRANVRLKVNCLRIRQPDSESQIDRARRDLKRYFRLYQKYFGEQAGCLRPGDGEKRRWKEKSEKSHVLS